MLSYRLMNKLSDSYLSSTLSTTERHYGFKTKEMSLVSCKSKFCLKMVYHFSVLKGDCCQRHHCRVHHHSPDILLQSEKQGVLVRRCPAHSCHCKPPPIDGIPPDSTSLFFLHWTRCGTDALIEQWAHFFHHANLHHPDWSRWKGRKVCGTVWPK